MIIPHDRSFPIPLMFLYNVIDLQLFKYHQIQLKEVFSIHIEFHPLKINLSYLFVHHFDPSLRQIDGWKILSPNKTSNDDLDRYFLNNEQTDNHQSLIFGIRQLNSTEISRFSSIGDLLTTLTEPAAFTSDYELRLYTLSSLYFDKDNQQWKSDGMRAGPKTNLLQTQCFSTHMYHEGLTNRFV